MPSWTTCVAASSPPRQRATTPSALVTLKLTRGTGARPRRGGLSLALTGCGLAGYLLPSGAAKAVDATAGTTGLFSICSVSPARSLARSLVHATKPAGGSQFISCPPFSPSFFPS